MKRINLIPPETGAKRQAEKQRTVFGIAYGGVVLLVAGTWLGLQLKYNHEQDRKQAAETKASALQVKVDSLSEFALMEQSVKQKGKTLASALTNDVHWSRLLREISTIMPDNSWLTGFVGTTEVAANPLTPQAAAPQPAAKAGPQPGAQSGAQATVTQPAPLKLGSLTFTAVTFDFPGVAKWITTVEQVRSVQNIFVPTAAKAQIGGRDVVNYTSTTDLSLDSASKRYQLQGQK